MDSIDKLTDEEFNDVINKYTDKFMLNDLSKIFNEAKILKSERDKAIDDITDILKEGTYNICDYCKNYIECKGEDCDCYDKGIGVIGKNGKEFPDFKWTCIDFDYGTCEKFKDTPCNGCYLNNCNGFKWKGLI